MFVLVKSRQLRTSGRDTIKLRKCGIYVQFGWQYVLTESGVGDACWRN